MSAIDVENEIWKLDQPNYFRDTSIDAYNYFKIYPTQGFNIQPGQTQVDFRLTDLNNYYVGGESLVHVQTQCTALTGLQPTTFTNDIRVALFDTFELQLNSSTVEQQAGNWDVTNVITRSFWSNEFVQAASNWGYFKNSDMTAPPYRDGAESNDFIPALYTADYSAVLDLKDKVVKLNPRVTRDYAFLDSCTGQGRRRSLAYKPNIAAATEDVVGKVLNFYIPLSEMSSFYRQFRRAHRGLDVSVMLRSNSNQMRRIVTSPTQMKGVKAGITKVAAPTAADGDAAEAGYAYASMKWDKAVWLIPNVRPSPSTEAKLNAMYQQGLTVPVRFERPQIYQLDGTTVTGGSSQSWRVVCSSARATRMAVTARPKTALTSQGVPVDEFVLPVQLQQIQTFVNGVAYPNSRIELQSDNNFADGALLGIGSLELNIADIFHSFEKMALQHKDAYLRNYSLGAGHQTLLEWLTANPMVVFDLSPGSTGAHATGTNTEIVVEMNFTDKGTTTVADLKDYDFYACVWTEREVRIDLSNASSYVSVD